MEGQALVAHLKKEHPDATIFEILELARKIHIERAAENIAKGQYESPVHIIEDLVRSGSTCEDVIDIFSILELNSWTPGVIQTMHTYFTDRMDRIRSPHCWSCLLRRRRTSNTQSKDQQ